MARELSATEKLEYDRLTRFCKQLTLADFVADITKCKNLPVTLKSGVQEDTTIACEKSS